MRGDYMLKKNIGLEDVIDLPVELEIQGKKFIINHPPLGVVALIENKRTQIINVDTKYMTLYMQKMNELQLMKEDEMEQVEKELSELLGEFIMRKIDIAAEIVQLIIEGRKPDGNWKISKEEIMWDWTIDDVLKVIEIYNSMVDLSDFFMKLTKRTGAGEKQTGEVSSSD